MPIIKDRQTITDIAVQYAGDAAMAPVIAKANGLNLTDEIPVGTEVMIPAVANNGVSTYFRINNQSPAMKVSTENRPDGIDYMEINNDFIVQ